MANVVRKPCLEFGWNRNVAVFSVLGLERRVVFDVDDVVGQVNLGLDRGGLKIFQFMGSVVAVFVIQPAILPGYT